MQVTGTICRCPRCLRALIQMGESVLAGEAIAVFECYVCIDFEIAGGCWCESPFVFCLNQKGQEIDPVTRIRKMIA